MKKYFAHYMLPAFLDYPPLMRIAPKRTIPLRKHNIKIICLLYGRADERIF